MTLKSFVSPSHLDSEIYLRFEVGERLLAIKTGDRRAVTGYRPLDPPSSSLNFQFGWFDKLTTSRERLPLPFLRGFTAGTAAPERRSPRPSAFLGLSVDEVQVSRSDSAVYWQGIPRLCRESAFTAVIRFLLLQPARDVEKVVRELSVRVQASAAWVSRKKAN